MPAFQNLDGWKVCQELVLATYQATDDLLEQRESRNAVHEDDVFVQMRYCALRATGRIVFASAVGQGQMRRTAISQALMFLAEFGSALTIVQAQQLLTRETCASPDALRGRGAFYTQRLLELDPGSVP